MDYVTSIRASCPVCGDVDLEPASVRLVIANLITRSEYSFTCPKCDDLVVKPAGADVIAVLKSGGVVPEKLHIPDEAMELHDGAPVNADDILDFHVQLTTVDRLVALIDLKTLPGSRSRMAEDA